MLRSFIIAAGGHLALLFMLVILSFIRPPMDKPKSEVRVRMITKTMPVSTPAPDRNPIRTTPTPAPTHRAPQPTPKPKPTATPKPKKAVKKKEVVQKVKKEIVKITPTPTPTPRATATPRPTPKATATPKPTPTPRVTPKSTPKPTPRPRVPDNLIARTPKPKQAVVATGQFAELGAAYSQQAIFLIQMNFKPSYAQQGTTAVVQFRIYRDGQIVNAKIKRSSGRADLDEYALQAVRKTAKLPPFYDTVRKTHMDVELVFSFDRK